MNELVKGIALVFSSVLVCCTAFVESTQAALIWNWSFGGTSGLSEQGTFTTTEGDTTDPNTIYEIIDFSVTQSGFGVPVGSLSDGTYIGPLDAGSFVDAAFRYSPESQTLSPFFVVPLSPFFGGFQFDGPGFDYNFGNPFFAPEQGMFGRLQIPGGQLTDGFVVGRLAEDSIPIPTPALLPCLIGMGAAALRKRQQEAEAEAEVEA